MGRKEKAGRIFGGEAFYRVSKHRSWEAAAKVALKLRHESKVRITRHGRRGYIVWEGPLRKYPRKRILRRWGARKR